MKISIEELKKAGEYYRRQAEAIRNVSSSINIVEMVTPMNLQLIKKDWIAKAKKGDFSSDPTLTYNVDNLKKIAAKRPLLNEVEKMLHDVRPKADQKALYLVWSNLAKTLNNAYEAVYLAEAILEDYSPAAKQAVENIYGAPSERIIKLAREIANDNKMRGYLDYSCKRESKIDLGPNSQNDSYKVDARVIKDVFEYAMSQISNNPWPVIISEDCSSIDVRDKSSLGHPAVFIPKDRHVTIAKLIQLTQHEILCHFRSSQAASEIGFIKSDDELFYEGLAAYMDREFDKNQLGYYNLNFVYYIIAIDEAKNGKSFSEVAKIIYDLLPTNTKNKASKAWTYTYRVFRGATDTKNPIGYAFTKDRAYFEGYLLARELYEKGEEDFLIFSTLDEGTFNHLMHEVDPSSIKKFKNELRTCNLSDKEILAYAAKFAA